MEDLHTFGIIDYIIFASMLLFSLFIGSYHIFGNFRSNLTTEEFLSSSNSFGPLVVSAIVSGISAVGVMGIPVEIYQNGIQFVMLIFGAIFAAFLTVLVYLPVLHNLRLMNVFQYLELRFSPMVRRLSTSVYVLQLCLYSGSVVYTPSLAVSQATGISLWTCVILTGLVCCAYSSLGGFKAVIWTDVFQFVILYIALCFILIQGISKSGDITDVWEIAVKGQRTTFAYWTNSSESRYTVWSLVFGGMFYYLFSIGLNPITTQRLLIQKTTGLIIWSTVLVFAGFVISHILFCIVGLIIYAEYHGCDPLIAGQITTRDQLLPLYVSRVLRTTDGINGLFLSGLVCASLSTLSSFTNTMVLLTMNDHVRLLFPNQSEEMSLKISKLLGLLYGLMCLGAVWIVQNTGSVYQALFLMQGGGNGTIVGIVTAGLFLPWVNDKGVTAGTVVSLMFFVWYSIGVATSKPAQPTAPLTIHGCSFNVSNFSNVVQPLKQEVFPLYNMNALWSALVGMIIVILTSVVVSAATGVQNPGRLSEGVVSPTVLNMWKYLSNGKKTRNIEPVNADQEVPMIYIGGSAKASSQEE